MQFENYSEGCIKKIARILAAPAMNKMAAMWDSKVWFTTYLPALYGIVVRAFNKIH